MKTMTPPNSHDADQVRDHLRNRYGAIAGREKEEGCGCAASVTIG